MFKRKRLNLALWLSAILVLVAGSAFAQSVLSPAGFDPNAFITDAAIQGLVHQSPIVETNTGPPTTLDQGLMTTNTFDVATVNRDQGATPTTNSNIFKNETPNFTDTSPANTTNVNLLNDTTGSIVTNTSPPTFNDTAHVAEITETIRVRAPALVRKQ